MPVHPQARWMLRATLGLWFVSWLLPAYANEGGIGLGWQCFQVAAASTPNLLWPRNDDMGILGFLTALSPWTNFLVPTAVLALHRRKPPGLRRLLAPLLLGSGLANLVWLSPSPGSLWIGYYLWVASFLSLGIAVWMFLRQEGPQAPSPFGRGRAVTVGAVVVILILAALSMPFLVLEILREPRTMLPS